MPQKMSDNEPVAAPVIIPPVELQGSVADRVRALDESIVRLQQLKRTLVGEKASHEPPYELHGPYLHAPVWPWFLAGWIIGALFVLMFVFARALA
jgi:hypothetical protein